MTKLSEMFSAVQSQQWVTAGNDVQYAFVQNGVKFIKSDWVDITPVESYE